MTAFYQIITGTSTGIIICIQCATKHRGTLQLQQYLVTHE